MVPVDGMITAAPVVVLLTDSLVCVGAIAARPVAEPDVAHWEEEGAAFGAAEESMALVGPIAHSFTYCCTLQRRRRENNKVYMYSQACGTLCCGKRPA